MEKKISRSFSGVNSVIRCPYKYMHEEFKTSEATEFGTKVHSFFEQYITNCTLEVSLLPVAMNDIKDLVDYVKMLKREKHVTSELHLDCETFNGFVDIITEDEICDIKTINSKSINYYRPERSEQMMLYAYYANLHYGYEINKITYLIYCKDTGQNLILTHKLDEEVVNDVVENFQRKRKTSTFIQENELDYAVGNEFCFFCSFYKECEFKKVQK